ncbi:hypothetical protein NIES3585_05870 [Nodularia sp. NIES-3585]|nr:hypothetical protein NIES3585_05870 [Nodularia sp. NIES-3585]
MSLSQGRPRGERIQQDLAKSLDLLKRNNFRNFTDNISLE